MMCLISSCDSTSDDNPSNADLPVFTYGTVQDVQILGYQGDAMEPFISADGNLLLFNNLNSATLADGSENDTNLHYATRIDATHFQYAGEIVGANANARYADNELEAVPSLDKNNTLYFVRTQDYADQDSPDYLRSMYAAKWQQGVLGPLSSVPNLSSRRALSAQATFGELNFDGEIHYDGRTLYFTEGLFDGHPWPAQANIGVAHQEAGVFQVDPQSARLFDEVNSTQLEYAPSISHDQLTLYFTRANPDNNDTGIYSAQRATTDEVWTQVQKVTAIQGEMVEAPCLSYDGRSLYFHQKVQGVYVIRKLDRLNK